MLGWCDCVDDYQLPATTWARQSKNTRRVICIVDGVAFIVLLVRDFGPKQLPDPRDIGRAVAIPIEPIMSDAVLASGQDVDQEPADELGRCQRHGGVAARAFKTVVLDLEGDAAFIKTDQATVRDGAPPSCLMILAVSMRIWNSCAARHLCQAAAEVGPFPSWSLRTVAE